MSHNEIIGQRITFPFPSNDLYHPNIALLMHENKVAKVQILGTKVT